MAGAGGVGCRDGRHVRWIGRLRTVWTAHGVAWRVRVAQGMACRLARSMVAAMVGGVCGVPDGRRRLRTVWTAAGLEGVSHTHGLQRTTHGLHTD